MCQMNRRLGLGMGLVCLLLTGFAIAADPGPVSVRAQVDRLHDWLGDTPSGQAWQKYLKSPQLLEQLEKGAAADATTVRQVLDAYDSQVPGLDRPQFKAVRTELAAWLVELQTPSAADLPGLLRAAKGKFKAPTDQQVTTQRAAVKRAADELDRFLARGGSAVVEGWRKYLGWDVLRDQLALETPDLQRLNTVLQSLYGIAPGLESAPFRNLRTALHQYMNTMLVRTTPAMVEQYDTQLEELAASLEAYAQQPSTELAEKIGETMGWLSSAGQGPELLTAIRHHYAQPNLEARVSGRFAAQGINGPVEEVTSVNDVILGTTINGVAQTRGDLQLALVPDHSRATFDIHMTGTAYSNNRGVNRGVQIYPTGATSINAVKRIFVDADGIHTFPAEASCYTNSTINSIEHCLRIVEKMAWKRATQQKADAQVVASAHAETRVEGRMNARTNEMLKEPRERFATNFRAPLLRRGEFPQRFELSTTNDDIHVRLMQANNYQLAAASPPPEISGDFDLSLRLHESFVRNFSEAALGGYELTDERLVKLLEENGREVPEELRIDPSKDPWSITFAADQPIRVEFNDQKVKIALRGRRFTRGEQVVSSEMDIWALYALTRTPEGAKLTREGEVQAEYTMGGFENAAKIAIKTLMRKKFDALFKSEIAGEGIQLKGRWGEAGPLKLGHLDASSGWLSLGWSLPAGAPHTAATVEETTVAQSP